MTTSSLPAMSAALTHKLSGFCAFVWIFLPAGGGWIPAAERLGSCDSPSETYTAKEVRLKHKPQTQKSLSTDGNEQPVRTGRPHRKWSRHGIFISGSSVRPETVHLFA